MKNLFLISVLILSGLLCFGQNLEDKILSTELRRLMVEEPEKERIIIICIKPDQYINELQLKCDYESPFSSMPYIERKHMALNHAIVKDAYEKLRDYGTPYYSKYGYDTPTGANLDSTNYYFYLNAYSFVVPAYQIEAIVNMKKVVSIIDGEQKIDLKHNTTSIQTNTFKMETDEEKERNIWSWENMINNNWGYNNVEIAPLHDLSYKGINRRIAIIDTGIEYDHPAVNLVAHGLPWDGQKLNVVATGWIWHYYWPNTSADDDDPDGHGTSVAGAAWVYAPWAEYIIYKLNYNNILYVSHFNMAVEFVKSMDANIISTSLTSTSGIYSSCPQELHDADIILNNASDASTITIAAAGNKGKGDLYPITPGYGASTLSVFSHFENLFNENNSPENACHEYGKPNIGAPGAHIQSLTLTSLGTVGFFSGSSFAAPITGGIAACLQQAINWEQGSFNSAVVRSSMLSTMRNISDLPQSYSIYNPGRINALWAYDKMLSKNPTVQITNPSNGANVTGTVNITVDASDEHSGMDYVEIWIGGVKKATLSQPPYNYSWNTSDNNPGNIQILAKAFDNVGNTASHSINVNVQATVVELYNGYVTPSSGFTGETYTFKVSYKNTNGVPPDANSVKIHIAGTFFEMNAGGSSWASGVEFSKNLTINYSGNYEYYFTGSVGGVNLRFPSSGFLNLSVTENAAGWDAAVTEVTASKYQFSGSSSITAYGKIKNQSNSPDKVYTNLPYTFKVFDPNGAQIHEASGTIGQLNQLQVVERSTTFTISSSSPNGMYQIVLTIFPTIDSNPQNNSGITNVYKGATTTLEQYHVTNNNAYVQFHGSPNYLQYYNFAGSEWNVTGGNTNQGRAFLRRDGGPLHSIYVDDIETYDGNLIMIACHIVQQYGIFLSFGIKHETIVNFESTVITGYPGQQVEFIAHTGQIFSATSPSFFSNNYIDDWYSHFQRFNNNKSIRFFFNIPTSSTLGHKNFYLASKLNSTGEFALTKLRITVLQPPPIINGLSSYSFSADDQITISGSNFGTSQGQVKFNSLNGSIVSWSNTSITCTVPVGVEDGLLTVVNIGGISNPMSYQVISSTGNPEVINPIPDQELISNIEKYIANLNVVFHDPNGHAMTFSVSTTDPEVSFNQSELNSGHLYLIASSSAQNSSSVTVTATDITNKSASDQFNVTIQCMPFNVPIFENFDAVASPALPDCWSKKATGENATAETSSWKFFSSPQSVHLSYWVGDYVILSSPAIVQNISDLRIKFKAYSLSFSYFGYPILEIGTIADPNDESTFEALGVLELFENNWEQLYFYFNNYSGANQHIAFKYGSLENGFSGDVFIDDILIELIPTCLEPISLTSGQYSNSTALLSWDNQGNENAWDIEWGLSGFNPGQGNFVQGISEKPYLLGGLQPGTTYDYYVRSNCGGGDVSYWEGPHTFTTAFIPPYYQDFDASLELPSGWKGDFSVQENRGIDNTNALSQIFYMSFGGGSNTHSIVETPIFCLSPGLNYKLMFEYRFVYSDNTPYQPGEGMSLNIDISFDHGNTFTTLFSIDQNNHLPSSNFAFVDINISPTSDFAMIRFEHPDFFDLGEYYVDIDDFNVIPFCSSPSNIASNNITNNDVNLSWDAGSNESQWNIIFGFTGFDIETQGTLLSEIMANPYTLTGLEPNTDYDVYVRAVCGEDFVSEWAGPVSFTTLSSELSAYPDSLNFGEAPINTCHTLNYQLTGTGLTDDVTITAPTGFQVSTQAETGFEDMIVIVPVGGSVNQEIWVRFCPTFNQSYDAFIANVSTGSQAINVAVEGIGVQPYCPGVPTVTDADGNTYNTVLIGNQCWMKENLNVGNTIQSSQLQTDNNIIEKYCFDDNPINCDEFGGMYTWSEAIRYSTSPLRQGLPPGWEYPYNPTSALIAIPSSSIPTINGIPLQPGDWIGTFYVNDAGGLSCAGAVEWTGTSNISLVLYGDDQLEPVKNGFDDGEFINFKVYSWEYQQAFNALADCYNDECKYFSNGSLSVMWSLSAFGYVESGIKGICPEGWHIPTDDDWKELEGYVDSQFGVAHPEWDKTDFRGFDAGKNLKKAMGWENFGNGMDLFGFSAVAGGRYSSNNFEEIGTKGFWWSSNEFSGTSSWIRSLAYNNDKSSRVTADKEFAISVRCIKEQVSPICTKPGSIEIFNITSYSANVQWTPGMSEQTWDIVYSVEGFNPENDGTLIPGITEIQYSISSLEPNTNYDVYVRAVCGEDFVSEWAGPVSFTTLASALSASPDSLNFGEVPTNGCSTLSYQLTGTGLTDDVTITAPTGFKVSTQAETGFEDMIVVVPVGGSVDQEIWVKFCPDEVGEYSGEITNVSAGASDVYVSLSGFGEIQPCYNELLDGLISYWKFDEGSGNLASDVHGNHEGSITGASWVDNGKMSKALSFGGYNTKNRVSLGNTMNPTIMPEGTFAAWINPGSLSGTGDGNHKTIFGQGSGTSGSSNYPFWIKINAGGNTLSFNRGGGTNAVTVTESGISVNNWYHIVCTMEGNVGKVYINGELKKTGTINPPGGTNYAFSIGNLGETTTAYGNTFAGIIDEPSIWDRALALEEIQKLYNGGIGLQYPFDCIPIVSTLPVIEITNHSARCGGNITQDYGSLITSRGVVWNTSGNPSLTNNEGYTSDGQGLGEFVSEINDLIPNTTYHLRAYATNNYGTGYGNETSFITLPAPLLSVDQNEIDFGNIVAGECATLSYQLTGIGLTDNVLITSPPHFQVSTSETTGFEAMITVPHTNGNVNQTIYVQFCPDEVGEYSGEIMNVSAGAETVVVEVAGEGWWCMADCVSSFSACEGDPPVYLGYFCAPYEIADPPIIIELGLEQVIENYIITFSGPGVFEENGSYYFDPLIGVGTYDIQYHVLETTSGCTASTSFPMTVQSNPIVICPVDFEISIDDPPFNVAGVSPVGGEFYGPISINGLFNPSFAGIGTHTITYVYPFIPVYIQPIPPPPPICYSSCSFFITVIPPITPGVPIVTPQYLEETLMVNASSTQILTISNPAGNTPVNWMATIAENGSRNQSEILKPLVYSDPMVLENHDKSIDVCDTTFIVTGEQGRTTWDVLQSFSLNAASQVGIVTDGNYFYSSTWNVNGKFSKYTLEGLWIEDFVIEGVLGIRDLTYDGQYFYGGASTTTIYKMDFVNKVLVGTISSPVNVRHISYDPAYDAFWCGSWTILRLVNRNGNSIITGPPLQSVYGTAYDAMTEGGPYLWLFAQNATTGCGTIYDRVQILQYSIADNALTGFVRCAVDIPGYVPGVNGGLRHAAGAFSTDQLIPGKFVLIVNIQQDPNLIGVYEIKELTDWLTMDAYNGVLSPGEDQEIAVNFDATGLEVDNYNALIVFEPDGEKNWSIEIPVALNVESIDCSAPENLSVSELTNFSGLLSWSSDGTQNSWEILWGLAGFDPLVEGNLIPGVKENPYLLELLIPSTDYSFYVRTECSNGLFSDWAGPYFFTTLSMNCPPPVDISAEQNASGVLISWSGPFIRSTTLANKSIEFDDISFNSMPEIFEDTIKFPGESTPNFQIRNSSFMLHYDASPYASLGLGASGGTIFTAARFPSSMLQVFQGFFLKSVAVVIYSPPPITKVQIWSVGTENSPGALLIEQSFTAIQNSWNIIDLSPAIELTGDDIWIGYSSTLNPNQSSLGMDEGPANPNGGWFSTNNGQTWNHLAAAGLNRNFNIRGLIEQGSCNLIGYNLYRNGELISTTDNETLLYQDTGLPTGIYSYEVAALYYGNEPFESVKAGPVEVIIQVQHQLDIPTGWSGVSSYLTPNENEIEPLLSPILSDLIILQSETGMYWPGENVNTIGNWSTHEGYKIKVASAVELTITGSRETNKTLQLSAGWNLIPVLSECAVDVEALFAGKDLVIVKEVAGWNLYWPEYGINTLGGLLPGKAYFVLMGSAGEITFPECDGMKNVVIPTLTGFDPARAGLSGLTPWPLTPPTAATHAVALPVSVAGELLHAGDFIGVFDQDGNCSGLGIWQGENTAITLFGSDPTTLAKDGFNEGEPLEFRLYRPDSNEEFNLEVVFDKSLPNPDPFFATNGLSAISEIKMSAAGVGISMDQDQIQIIPNPAREEFLLVLPARDFAAARLELYRTDGQFIQTKTLNEKETRVDISNLPTGVYILKVEIDGQRFTKRLVKY